MYVFRARRHTAESHPNRTVRLVGLGRLELKDHRPRRHIDSLRPCGRGEGALIQPQPFRLVGLGRLELKDYRPRRHIDSLRPCGRREGRSSRRSPTDESRLVGLGRLELPTSPLSGARSNHLSYRPRGNWWSWSGSNRRPPECKSGALPAELQPLSFKLYRGQLNARQGGKLTCTS